MRQFRICVAAIILAVTHGFITNSKADSLSVSFGIGYDFLSQEYFFDSLLVDTLDASLDLKTTYLNDIKAQINLDYLPLGNRDLQFRSTWEQSKDDARLHINGDLRTRIGSLRLDFLNELEFRENLDDSVDAGDSYVYGRTRSKLRVPLSESVSGWTEVKADFIQFDSVADFSQNHYRIGGKLGTVKYFANFSSLDLNLFIQSRIVPDSAEMDYLNGGLEGAFFGFYTGGEVNVFARYESKDYNRGDGEDDYSRFEVDARNKIMVSERAFTRQEFEAEVTRFSDQDLINFDFSRLGLAFLGGYEFGYSTFAAGPELEILSEENNDLSGGQDYVETGLKIDLNYIKPGLLFASLESQTGFRNIEEESDLQSDFTYERLNLVADLTLAGAFHFNILLSSEWEWHQQEEENNQIMLLSSGLSYSF